MKHKISASSVGNKLFMLGPLALLFLAISAAFLVGTQGVGPLSSLLSAVVTQTPVISGLSTSGLDPWSTEIRWETTGFPSDSLVYYGTSANNLTMQATRRCGTDTGGLVTSHCVYIGLLFQNATYFYKVRSASGSTVLVSDAAQSFTVPPLTMGSPGWENVPPSIPTGVSAQAISSSAITVSWLPATDNSGVGTPLTYKVFRNGSVVNTPITTNFSDSGLTPGTMYTYKVRAVDPSGNASADSVIVSAQTSAAATIDSSTAPATPSGFTATYVPGGTISFSWADTPNEYSFKAYQRPSGATTWTVVGEYGKDVTHASIQAPAKGKFDYAVKACNGVGCSAESGAVSLSINICESASCDITPPSQPTSLRATRLGPSRIDIAWNPSTDDVTVTKYKLFRAGAYVTDVSGTTTYTDTVVGPGYSYSYYVVAVDEASLESEPSNNLVVTTPYFEPVVPTTPPPVVTPPVPVPSPTPNPSPAQASTVTTAPQTTTVVPVSMPIAVTPVITPPASTKFTVGGRIRTNISVNVRESANILGAQLGKQALGAAGTVVGGPVAQGGYIWWKVNYDSGVDGWSVENYLVTHTGSFTTTPSASLVAVKTSAKPRTSSCLNGVPRTLVTFSATPTAGAYWIVSRNGYKIGTFTPGTKYFGDGKITWTAYANKGYTLSGITTGSFTLAGTCTKAP